MKTKIIEIFFLFFACFVLGCNEPFTPRMEKICVKKNISREKPPFEAKEKYIFSKYKKNAMMTGTRIRGTGLWEELSFEEKEKRALKYDCDSWEIVEFLFMGEKYLFLKDGRNFWNTLYRPTIYGGKGYKSAVKTFQITKLVNETALFSIKNNGEDFLVVFMRRMSNQYKHSSILFILDSNFVEIYKEEISGKPYEVGIFIGENNKECFFIKNIDTSLEYLVYEIYK